MLTQRQSGLAVVRSYLYLHEADVAKALLESYGIEAFLLDEHAIRQRWHLAGAVGGVKLAVAPEHAYRARQVLEDDHSEVLDDIDEASLPPHEDECCPRCGAASHGSKQERRISGPLQWLVSFAFLFLGGLAARRRVRVSRQCPTCALRWSVEETR